MKKITLTFILVLCLSVFAYADRDTLRCPSGRAFVHIGDGKISVSKCMGEPAYKDSSIIRYRTDNGAIAEGNMDSWSYVISGWEYQIVFLNGKVSKIEKLGRE